MKTKKRIFGLDFARAWAMFGMLLVNFMVITGAEGNGPPLLKTFMTLFEGRASALFVILAGIGITLMNKSSVASQEKIKINTSRILIWKRSLFLFILGLLLYVMEWTGDILHYYGVYLFIAALLITVRRTILIWLSIIILILCTISPTYFQRLRRMGRHNPIYKLYRLLDLNRFSSQLIF